MEAVCDKIKPGNSAGQIIQVELHDRGLSIIDVGGLSLCLLQHKSLPENASPSLPIRTGITTAIEILHPSTSVHLVKGREDMPYCNSRTQSESRHTRQGQLLRIDARRNF